MSSTRFRSHSLLFHTGILLCGLLVLSSMRFLLLPRIGDGMYSVDGGQIQNFHNPLVFPSRGEKVMVAFELRVSSLYRPDFDLLADDCLQRLNVNGQSAAISAPFCDTVQRRVQLRDLRPGSNRIVAEVRDTGGAGAFRLSVSRTDPVALTLAVLTLLLCCWFAWTALGKFSKLKRLRWYIAVVTGGGLLRWLYMLATPLYMRAHEWDREIEYIRYLLDHWHVPPAAVGWEFCQPPLYFALLAAYARMASLAGQSFDMLFQAFQTGSLLLSVGTLIVAAWIAVQLFGTGARSRQGVLFLSLIASSTGLIFLSSAVNNDVLVTFLSFLSFALLLAWWRGGRNRLWIAFSVVFALAVLTKNTALPLAGVAGFCLFSARIPWRKRLTLGLWFLVIVVTLTGWLFMFRASEGSAGLVGNTAGLDPALRLHPTVNHLIGFNPHRVLEHPYVNPTGGEIDKEFFLEYLFRSSFFGEFRFDTAFAITSFLIMLFALGGFIASAFGFLIVEGEGGYRRSFPLLATFAMSLLFLLVGRIVYPYSTTQDFRYVPLLIVPVAYYAVRVAGTRSVLLMRILTSILWALVFSETLFLLQVFFLAH
ncbi:MAG: hypothetical protein WCS85_01940 [Candidatus Peribacteraceae bacterium]